MDHPTRKTRARRKDSVAYEARYYAVLERIGAFALVPYPANKDSRVYLVCRRGHLVKTSPKSVVISGNACRFCGQADRTTTPKRKDQSVAAEKQFRGILHADGATALTPYTTRHAHVLVVCERGHETKDTPNNILRRGRACGECPRPRSNAAVETEARYYAILDEIGAFPLVPYPGRQERVHLVCSAGHLVATTPHSVIMVKGVCNTCGRVKRGAAQRAQNAPRLFRLLDELGCTLLDPEYLGVLHRHNIRCSQGHHVQTSLVQLERGDGPCHLCAGSAWDAFYVVQDPVEGLVKFGISSGSAKGRLYAHQISGFTVRHRLFTGLPEGRALRTEQAVREELDRVGLRPARGREYFHDFEALDRVLSFVDHRIGAYDQ